jgi:VIT family
MHQNERTPAVSVLIDELERHGEGRLLDPVDRSSEILFGLFMVLTFTGTLSVATTGRQDVKLMLIAAIGCNTAWGFVDAAMYVVRNLIVRAREATFAAAIRAAHRPEDAHRLIANQMGPMSAGLDAAGLERAHQWILAQPAPVAGRAMLTSDDLRSALGVFLLVFASVFPVVLPFFFTTDVQLAMRLSAAIAIVMMFVCGYEWGRYAGLPPWRAGIVLVLLGVVVEAVVIALGG